MLMTPLTTLYLLSLSLFAAAAPAPAKREVWDPTLTYPHAGTVWYVGQRHNVTWDTWNAPPVIDYPYGTLVLRSDTQGPIETIADGFNISLGRTEVTVPNVPDGDDYNLVLFGDSGNWGPTFSIYTKT